VNVMRPYAPDTHHLMDEQAPRRMRGYTILLNCTRGRIAGNRTLYRKLSEG
jgi:phosphoglycerate dehydrogenase-like enzyme